jgi:hypothetical protein
MEEEPAKEFETHSLRYNAAADWLLVSSELQRLYDRA